MDIVNFLQVSENIASSGQPSVDDFDKIARLGYRTVVNLALASSDNAIPNEGEIVTELGMSYIHIPVQWDQPTAEQFGLFAAVMRQHETQKVWVHCALNMRVSAFLYLYNILYRNEPKENALEKMNEIWQPNDVWSVFIDNVEATS